MYGPSPSLALPCSTLLPRHSNTDSHDCVHTSPWIPGRPHTWHADTRAHTATPTPAAPTLSLVATSAPCCSSVCTTAACPVSEAVCKLVHPFWRAGVRSAAGPHRQERPRQAEKLSSAGHPALRTRTSGGTLQQGVAWGPPSMQKRTRHGSDSHSLFHSR
jgi:hypothetical protein